MIKAGANPKFQIYSKYVIDLKFNIGHLKRKTYDRYLEFWNRISNSTIGKTRLRRITPQLLNEFYLELSQPGMNKNTGGMLSRKTIIEHHRFISSVLAFAVKERQLETNVAKLAIPPKATKPKVQYFQLEDIRNIQDCVKNEHIKWQVAINLLLVLGGRRGEIVGLKWSNINLSDQTIVFDHAMYYSPSVGTYEDTLKNDFSIRTLYIPADTVFLLKLYRKWYLNEKLRKCDTWDSNDYVFVSRQGKHMHPDTITDWMRKFSKKYNLTHANPKACRHTMASVLYKNKIDTITISRRLGHAKPSTTSDIYAHLMNGADEEAAECLAQIYNY